MKKSNQILIITLCVAIVLVGVYFLLFNVLDLFGNPKTQDGTQDVTDLTMVSYQEADLKQMTIINSTGTYVFAYSDDATLDFRWEMQFPSTFDAYPFYAYKYCNELLKLSGIGIVENPDDNGSVYGFDKPTAHVKYGTAEEVVELIIGASTPTGSGYYATVDNGRSVYIVDNSLIDDVEMFCIENLASDYLFVSRKDRVQEIAFVRGDELVWHLRRELMGEKNWAMIAPVTALGERTTIEDSLLVDVVNLQYDSIVEKECTELSKYGLDKPAYKVYVQEYGQSPTVLLLSSRESGKDGKIYGCYQGQNDVFAINQYDLGFLDINTFDLVASVAYYAALKDLTAFEYKLGQDVYRVDIIPEGDDYTYTLNGEGITYEQATELYTSGVWLQADEIFLLSVEETDYLTIAYYLEDGTTKTLEFKSIDKEGAQFVLYEDGYMTGLLFYRTTLEPVVKAISGLKGGE